VKSSAEVQLHFLRHAHAGDSTRWHGPDAERPLSDRGREQAERMARFIVAAGFRPDLIVSSPKLRALETAEPVASALGLKVAVDEALAGGLELESLENLLSRLDNPARPLLVGHDPDFSEICARLTGAPEVPVRKGALVRIDAPRPIEAGTGLIRWLVPPELAGARD
jgi:phosphohistidine phosphatase SixA